MSAAVPCYPWDYWRHIHVFVFLAISCFPANQINRLERNPKICEAITKKFAECLRRAEEIGTVLDEGGPGPNSKGDAAVARRLGTKPEGGEDGDDPGKISWELDWIRRLWGKSLMWSGVTWLGLRVLNGLCKKLLFSR